MFSDVSERPVTLGSRAWYTLPLSIAAHVTVFTLLVVIPLIATDVLPSPRTVLPVFTPTAELPEPPPPPAPSVAAPTTPSTAPPATVQAAPAMAPDVIAPESPVVATPAGPGVPGGIDFGLPGGGTGAVNIPEPPRLAPPPSAQTYRPGGNIKVPAKIHHVPPVYPRIAQEARVDGTVILEATIGTDGRVTDVRVLRSKPLLDQAAIDAVRQWRFTPTLLNGVPVPIMMTVTVTFTLK
jgi:protein TonB